MPFAALRPARYGVPSNVVSNLNSKSESYAGTFPRNLTSSSEPHPANASPEMYATVGGTTTDFRFARSAQQVPSSASTT